MLFIVYPGRQITRLPAEPLVICSSSCNSGKPMAFVNDRSLTTMPKANPTVKSISLKFYLMLIYLIYHSAQPSGARKQQWKLILVSSKSMQLGASDKPHLLALQQLVIGGDFNVQGQLEIHQLMVLPDLAGQVLLGPPQGLLQLADVFSGLLQVLIALAPHVRDLLLQALLLRRQRQ